MVNFLLARRYLFRGKAKHISFISIVSSLGIIIGVAAVIVALSIVNGIDGGLMDRIMRFKPHLIVEGDEARLREVQDKVVQWEGVDSAYLSLQTQVFAKMDTTIVPLLIKGMEFGENQNRGDLTPYVLAEKGKTGFYVGRSLARHWGVKDTIEFYPLEKKLELLSKPVRGIFSVGLYDVDNYCLIADIKEAQALSSNYRLSLEIKIDDPYAAAQFKEKILENFQSGIYVSTWIESNQALFATLKLEKFAMLLILALIVLISSFNIFAMLTVKVVEKTKDIGIMKALGFTSARITWIFALQGVMIGVIGTGLGTLLGLGICKFLKTYPVVKLPQEVFFTENLPIVIQLSDIIAIAVVAVMISIVASIFPARKAGKMEVCEALRYE